MRDDSTRSPLPAPLNTIAAPLAAMYRTVVAQRNRRFDRGIGVYQPAIPTISVGNLSVGGVGKTPVVQHLAHLLRSHGHEPAILLRGYKSATPGKRRTDNRTSGEVDQPGANGVGRGGRLSDEEAEHRAVLPDMIVVADPDRVASARMLTDPSPNRTRQGAAPFHTSTDHPALGALPPGRPTCFLLDDGFQHRRLGRTLDLVLIDARRSPWNDRILPAGWLREPVGSLRRADAVILTHVDLASEHAVAELIEQIEMLTGRPPIAHTRHVWSGLRIHEPPRLPNRARQEAASGDTALPAVSASGGMGVRAVSGSLTTAPTAWLRGRRVLVCCAIGEPEQFLHMVEDSGATIIDRLILRDHAGFSRADLAARIARLQPRSGDAIVSTGKDWLRLAKALPAELSAPIAYPLLSIEATFGGAALDEKVLRAVGGAPLPSRARQEAARAATLPEQSIA